MTKFEFTRSFIHRTFGDIGSVEVTGEATVALDGKALPDTSVQYLMNFALQSLQDAYAGAKDATEAGANWQKKLDALIEGTVGVRSGGGGVDAMTKLCRAVAREILRSKMALAGKPYKDFTAKDADEQNAVLDKIINANRDTIEAEAKKRLAAKSKLADSVDLGDLGL